MEIPHNLQNQEDSDFLEYSGHGLTTRKALERLHDEINQELTKFQGNDTKRKCQVPAQQLVHESFHHGSFLSLFRWTSALILFLGCFFLLITYSTEQNQRFECLPIQAFIILCVIILNILLICWETNLRHRELPDLTQKVLKELKDYSSFVSWESANYPHLHSPLSPCITLQWTKRDNSIVNLPWSLLVRGDVILLRPGQKVPGKCQLIESGSKCTEGSVLYFGDVFSPYLEGVGEGLNSPKARVPLQEIPFLLLETPYLINLRILLSEALNRPATIFNKQGHFIFAKGMELICLPVMAIFALGINIFRLYYDGWPGHWSETILTVPFTLIFPLVPFLIPLVWVVLNWIGTASVLAMYMHSQNNQKSPSENPFEEGELQNLKLSKGAMDWKDVKREFLNILLGRQEVPIRTANLTHVLATITNLCCVDKKGILSWPNPTAEKLFFLRNRAHGMSRSNIFASATSLCKETEQCDGDDLKNHERNSKESECVLMSLTHDHLTAFGLQFDDLSWKRYLLSLKPLGLNILLNTCNPATQNHYTKFCSHITCEAMYNEDLVPVSQRSLHETSIQTENPVYSRGCLCELPKQMGFRSKAQEPFQLEHQLSTFRHVPLDMACKDRLARSLSITKLKFPFPHMVSVLLRDKCSGKLELMSQGTADIVLDSCTDYWDGYDVSHLTEKDRKKVLDFYHRTSLSAYCTAFSYRPTSCTIKENLTDFYMELPIDPSHLYHAARTPTPHISTEALFGDSAHTEYEEISDVEDSFRMQCKQIFIGMVTMQYQAKTDMVRMIEELEESCIRFVHFSKENELRSRVFSEKMGLESGWNCHISLLSDRTRTESGNSSRAGNASAKTSGLTLFRQSNEDLNSPDLNRIRINRSKNFLRSKSLRRKVTGLRSALEVSRALSHSAPSAINLEVAQVKFDEEVSICSRSSFSDQFSEGGEDQRLIDSVWDCAAEEGGEFSDGNGEFEESELRGTHQANGIQHSQAPLQGSIASSHLQSTSVEETSSSEQSASLDLFDMSNRARLPKGIENIRPHLENVDNVPLLVSLFTDCTTPTTKAMLAIMQEYTEVVVVLGSTANAENMTLFMRADMCIGVAPSHPQVCMREPVFTRPVLGKGPPPMEVARKLNSLPCSLSFNKDDRISLVKLILKSRHFMQHFMSCFQFWACCNLSVCCVQFIAITAFLPPVLSSGDVLWMTCVPIPILSVSLAFAPLNPAVMNQATGKNAVTINKESLKYVLLYYVTKFGPAIVIVTLSTIWTFASFCQQVDQDNCEYVYPTNSSSPWGGWGETQAYSLNTVQKMVTFQLVFYLSVISISFVHRMYQLWDKNPLTNKIWAAGFLLVLFLQVVYTVVNISTMERQWNVPGYLNIPLESYLLAFIWPLLLLPVNELIKRREIRVNVRYQKRARLEFGTKLGMNSPF